MSTSELETELSIDKRRFDVPEDDNRDDRTHNNYDNLLASGSGGKRGGLLRVGDGTVDVSARTLHVVLDSVNHFTLNIRVRS